MEEVIEIPVMEEVIEIPVMEEVIPMTYTSHYLASFSLTSHNRNTVPSN